MTLTGSTAVWAQSIRGRVRLDYQNLTRSGWNSSQMLQEYNVSAVDELFVKNTVTFSLRLNRMNDLQSRLSVNRARLRLGLQGDAYEVSLLYTPPHHSSVTTLQQDQKADNFLATCQYHPRGRPRLRFEYRQSRRTMPTNGLRRIISDNRQHMLQLDHKIGPLVLGGTYRAQNSSSYDSSSDQETRNALLRASIYKQFGRTLKTDLAADYQRTDSGIDGQPDMNYSTNLRFGTIWTASPTLFASVRTFLRNSSSDKGSTHQVNYSRELATRCVYRPTSTFQMEVRRDLRRSRSNANTLYSDLMRFQASYAGTLRKKLKGRINLIKNVTVNTDNMAAPSDNMDISLDFHVYRRTTGRASLAMSRQQHRDDGFLARYSSLRTVELRSRLTHRITANFTYRSSGSSPSFTLSDADVHNLSAGFNYTSKRGVTFTSSMRRTYLAQMSSAQQTSYNANLSLRVNPRVTLAVDGALNGAGGSEKSGFSTTFNTRLQLQLGKRTNAVFGYQAASPVYGSKSNSFTGSMTASF